MLHEMPAPAIRTAALTKDFGAGRGVFGLELQVNADQAFGLLGAGGAGKTTTARLLMGLIQPTRGSAYVFGLDCMREAVEVKRRVGYAPASQPDFGSTRGGEVVAYVAGLRGGVNADDVRDLASQLDLDLGVRYCDYDESDRQKLCLVLAFMHHPDLLILDKPFQRLHADTAQEVRALITDAREAGATVFLATDVVTEVEQLCDSVAVLRRGRLARVVRAEDLHGNAFDPESLEAPRHKALPPA